jgi:hypothetical protein
MKSGQCFTEQLRMLPRANHFGAGLGYAANGAGQVFHQFTRCHRGKCKMISKLASWSLQLLEQVKGSFMTALPPST